MAQSVTSFHGSTDSQNPHRNQCYCDLQVQNRTQTERCLGLLTSLCRLASKLQVHQGSVSQKIRWAVIKEDIQHLFLAYTHIRTDIDIQTHRHAQRHTQT